MCLWLTDSEEKDRQFTLQELKDQLSTYLHPDVPVYSTTQIKRRLLHKFGNNISIAEVDGRSNIVTLKDRAHAILHDTYDELTSQSDDDHNIMQAKMVGSKVRCVLQVMEKSPDVYPSPTDINIDKLEAQIPKQLLALVSSMVTETRSETAASKKNNY